MCVLKNIIFKQIMNYEVTIYDDEAIKAISINF